MSRPIGVSIIIPNYNYGRFIGEAIDSALAQTHEPVEVIVVDDGSTDDSRAVIESYGDRIKAIFQENAGQTRACLHGSELAGHEILVFLDSDDGLVPEAAATIAAEWEPGLAKLQFQLQTIDADGHRLGTPWPKFPPNTVGGSVLRELLRTGGYLSPPTSGNAFARSVLRAAAPLGGHRFVDIVLNTVAPLYGDIKTLHQALGRYRVHGANNGTAAILDPERFAGFAANERQKMAILETHCTRLGIAFESRAIIEQSLWLRELELVRAKLDANAAGLNLDVLEQGVKAIRVSLGQPEGLGRRLLRVGWCCMVVVAPRSIGAYLIAARFDQRVRPPMVDRLLALVSGRGGVIGLKGNEMPL